MSRLLGHFRGIDTVPAIVIGDHGRALVEHADQVLRLRGGQISSAMEHTTASPASCSQTVTWPRWRTACVRSSAGRPLRDTSYRSRSSKAPEDDSTRRTTCVASGRSSLRPPRLQTADVHPAGHGLQTYGTHR